MAAEGETQAEFYGDIINTVEVENYIASISKIEIENIGSMKWQNQHEYIEKLNMQAIQEVSLQKEENVKESLILQNKVNHLIFDVITIDIWQNYIFPEIIKMGVEDNASLPLYMTLFHEATVCSLLEAIMYHRESCECADEYILDLLDYCYQKMTLLVSTRGNESVASSLENQSGSAQITSTAQDLLTQKRKLEFDIGIKALSILKSIIDHMECLPLSVVDRLLNTYDIPCFFAQLLDDPPWKKRSKQGFEVYAEGKWTKQSMSSVKLCKIDGQVWLSLYQLLLSPSSRQKYDIQNFNKTTLLKLRRYFTEALLDQLPCLADLQRFIENVSVMDAPHISRSLILEQVPAIREQLLKRYSDQWNTIAQQQIKRFYSPTQDDLKRHAGRLAATYDIDILERMLTDIPLCTVCSSQAEKRCGRCQNCWYCSRECQMADWPKHKVDCKSKS